MAENLGAGETPSPNDCSESSSEYLSRAARACEAGDLVLGMHLYLAAYEKASSDPARGEGAAVVGLREAWRLACDLKERSMAEYVFEKLEPYLTGAEIAHCAACLQDLALDRLEEYGFSREELQDMAEMISEELMDSDASIVTVESITIPGGSSGSIREAFERASEARASDAEPPLPEPPHAEPSRPAPPRAQEGGRPPQVGFGVAPADDFNPYELYGTSSVGTSYHAATNEGSGAYIFTRDKDRAAEAQRAGSNGRAGASEQADAEAGVKADASESADVRGESDAGAWAAAGDGAQPDAESGGGTPARPVRRIAPPPIPAKGAPAPIPTTPDGTGSSSGAFSYSGLSGFDGAIGMMRDLGIGLEHDPDFQDFIDMLNAEHGLDRMPALDTLLFRAPAPEDAARFVEATIGEIGLPVLRMAMEENAQGMPVLSVAVQGDNRPRMNHAHNRFEAPAILVIEELDLWMIPSPPEGMEGIGGFLMASMTRGAREAINLIHSAVEDPDVYVFVTASGQGDIEPFFYDLIEPVTVIDIANPTEEERADMWAELVLMHPSLRGVDRADLIRYSAGLSRFDLYMAARAALEDAYKAGLVERRYVPVTADNILEKLAACYPLDSDEYRAIEDAVVRSFGAGLDDLGTLTDGQLG